MCISGGSSSTSNTTTTSTASNKMKIYLAGPDVFELNAIEIGKKKVELCNRIGSNSKSLEGLFPLDNTISHDNKTPTEVAYEIYNANIKMIQQSDIVIANLSSFRGSAAEPDSGTVFEIGYAVALNKPVIGYITIDQEKDVDDADDVVIDDEKKEEQNEKTSSSSPSSIYSYLNRYRKSHQVVTIQPDETKEESILYLDEQGKIIENFDLPLNLMLSCSVEKIIISTKKISGQGDDEADELDDGGAFERALEYVVNNM